VASTEVAAYRGDDKTRYAEAENGWLPFISIADAQNVAIVGEGTIDGQGAVWWERWRENIRATGKKGGTDRPRLIYITRASNVLIDGVTLTHSPSFHVVTRYAHDVDINGTRILRRGMRRIPTPSILSIARISVLPTTISTVTTTILPSRRKKPTRASRRAWWITSISPTTP
jgi:hypothetical protein